MAERNSVLVQSVCSNLLSANHTLGVQYVQYSRYWLLFVSLLDVSPLCAEGVQSSRYVIFFCFSLGISPLDFLMIWHSRTYVEMDIEYIRHTIVCRDIMVVVVLYTNNMIM